jgi:adenosylcobyric acid synthase
VGGTASHVGKSWTAAAICRWLRQRGVRVAPFKAQNMSNNSYPASDGGEIGRAQAAQAAACGLEPVTDMNPILLKPHSGTGSQVIVHGRVWKDLTAAAYAEHFEYLRSCVLQSYHRLASTFEFIVIEGAGSVAEVNLRARDLVNFGLATEIGAPALLVSDIDRGGVFASLTGTLDLLSPPERSLVRAFAVNRFRGNAELFRDGIDFLERRTGIPCAGVFPAAEHISLEDEDAVSVEGRSINGADVAIVRLPRVSNFTDFDCIDADWITDPVRLLYSHIILPGTKNTTGDLEWMRERGLDAWVHKQHAAGAQIIGVCGGYQILGEWITEAGRTVRGLGLLPVETVMQPAKTVRRAAAAIDGTTFEAYEIHMGRTRVRAGEQSFALVDGSPEGIRAGRCVGTYLHDSLRSPAVLQNLGICGRDGRPRQETYDALARWFDENADTRLFQELYLQ